MVPAEKLPQRSYYDMGEHKPKRRPRRKPKRSRIPAMLKICVVAAICVILAMAYLNQQIEIMHLSLQLVDLEQQVNQVQSRNDHLLVQLESARSLKVVEQIARTQLGMVEPTHSSSLVVAPTQIIDEKETRRASAEVLDGDTDLFASLANWLNRVLPLGGVEAGTLRR